MIKTGSYTRERAKCEFAGRKLSYKEEYSDLKLDDVDVNESVESASNATIGQILDKMVHKRRLVLAILLKQAGSHFIFNELRCKYRRFSCNEEDMTLEARAARVNGIASSFGAYSNEEVLSGDDQWYCSKCKEHRDIKKKMEIYSVPKIFIIQLKRF